MTEETKNASGLIEKRKFYDIVLVPLWQIYGQQPIGMFPEDTLREGLARTVAWRKFMPTPAHVAEACRAFEAERNGINQTTENDDGSGG
ncbi:MAG: hypothetical protein ABW189_06505 [Rickettsiales bacterium]